MRARSKGKLPPFVPLTKSVIDTPAWKATSFGARSLYSESLKRFLNEKNLDNNGKLYRSARCAAKDLGCATASVVRWFRELEHYGFIVKTAEGCLGVDGEGIAPHWRLTERPCNGHAATRDYERWDGVLFEDPAYKKRQLKKQNPVLKTSTPRAQNKHIPEGEKPVPVCAQNKHIETAPRRAQNKHITTYHSPSPQGLCWSTPTITEASFTAFATLAGERARP